MPLSPASRRLACVVPIVLLTLGVLCGCGERSPLKPLLQAPEAPSPWVQRSADELSAPQVEQLVRATSARDHVMGELQGALGRALAEGTHADAVTACQVVAPGLHEVDGRHIGLTVGRTSHRLRSPKNSAPEWAQPFVDAQTPLPTVLSHPDGRLVALFPILTAEACLACHGQAADIATATAERIEALYPNDAATGFTVGEPRGWFWVDVPAIPD